MVRAIIYTRVSTQYQVGNDHISLELQEKKCEAVANLKDYEDKMIFKEEGKSGRTMKNRPILKLALSKLKEGDALIFYSLSRLIRNVKECYDIFDQVTKKKAFVFSATEPIDTSTSFGMAIVGFLAIFAQLESDITGERIKDALAQRRANGERYSSRIPYGYKIGDDGKKLIGIPEQQKIINRIVDLKNKDNFTFSQISKYFNTNAVPPSGTSREWTHVSVKRIYEKIIKDKENFAEVYKNVNVYIYIVKTNDILIDDQVEKAKEYCKNKKYNVKKIITDFNGGNDISESILKLESNEIIISTKNDLNISDELKLNLLSKRCSIEYIES
uniref:Resolvase n=1 Tax=Pithovirus LCPAC104 TaxID=2506589 RepID=A0A481Z649_9VIRU|nr:MAG: resolvase [Pithovirus LCPAC104]